MHSKRLKSLAALGIAAVGLSAIAQSYKVTNIISDGSVPANLTDANFINPWGISASGTWWINAQGTGLDYVVAAAGTVSFKVSIPAASGVTTATGLPAGSVTTAGAIPMLLPNGIKASFLFSTLDGMIAGWNSALGTNGAVAQIAINNSAAGASYPDLAILNIVTGGVTSSSYILAANFGTGNAIEVYDNTFKSTKLAGTFTDPNLPAGYAPFSIHVIGTQIFVAYAQRTATAPFRTVNGSGNGVVDIFDTSGNFVSRAITGGNLNAPWGIAFAPANFGVFSKDLLVGNFGDGIINVYDPKTFSYIGQLIDATGKPLSYASLWELLPGGTAVTGTTSVSGGDTSTVYFTAGLAGEAHGLFAGITNATIAGSSPTFGFSAATGTATVTAGSAVSVPLSAVPANGFTGVINLSCSGLPIGATCTFNPTVQINVAANTVGFGSMTIQTQKASASVQPHHFGNARSNGILSAMLLPFASILIFRRRRSSGNAAFPRLMGVMLILIATTGFIAGCSSSTVQNPSTPTPAGQSTVTVTASSGAVTQTTSIVLTVK